jgi:hypothetical protein
MTAEVWFVFSFTFFCSKKSNKKCRPSQKNAKILVIPLKENNSRMNLFGEIFLLTFIKEHLQAAYNISTAIHPLRQIFFFNAP